MKKPVPLDSSIRYLKGVGEKRAAVFVRLGVHTIRDLLYFFPRRYDDRRTLTPLNALTPGDTVCVVAEVASLSFASGAAPTMAMLTDGNVGVRAVWFGGYAGRGLHPGDRVALHGRVESFNRAVQLTNPEFEVLTDQPPQLVGGIVPIYPLSGSLPQRQLHTLIDRALEEYAGQLVEFLPEQVRERHGMKALEWAVRELHHPSDEASWVRARNRLAFDELFLLQVGLLLRRKASGADSPPISLAPGKRSAFFRKRLPFPLTPAQERVIGEIFQDIQGTAAMNRLLQGDVGSGKTLVAVAAILAAVDSGAQAAFMAPTEILAQQHYIRMKEMLAPLDIRVGLLTGSVRPAERRELLVSLQSGELQVLVGTHAVFAETTAFFRLGLVVVDEQHRFGVLQKNALIAKGTSPHVLVMTATPIPRTLVLSVYGDLDVSVLDEMPPGRKPIRTLRMGPGEQGVLLAMIRDQVRQGRQAYWVCPLIEEGEAKSELSAVTSRFEALSELLSGVRLGLLHGRLPMKEKSEVMRRFAEGTLDLLVATSVIEVGVDIPNATLMVVEDAGQFGMAQLHQLRGRIGRGESESLCVLLEGEGTTPQGRERIETMVRTSDGFALAEADLEQRGPGEVCGVRQHGVTDFRVANLTRDQKLLALARTEARLLLSRDPELREEPRFRAELTRRLSEALDLARTA